jgi:hypothetical protein
MVIFGMVLINMVGLITHVPKNINLSTSTLITKHFIIINLKAKKRTMVSNFNYFQIVNDGRCIIFSLKLIFFFSSPTFKILFI